MRYLSFCRCGAAVPVSHHGITRVGCGRDRRSCGKPVELTASEILERDRQVELEAVLSWQALGVNMSSSSAGDLARLGSAMEVAQ